MKLKDANEEDKKLKEHNQQVPSSLHKSVAVTEKNNVVSQSPSIIERPKNMNDTVGKQSISLNRFEEIVYHTNNVGKQQCQQEIKDSRRIFEKSDKLSGKTVGVGMMVGQSLSLIHI